MAVNRVIREAEIVLLVADARMPVLSMNKEVKYKVEARGKRIFIVFNKIDLISKKELDSLRKENANAFFVSGTTKAGINKMRERLVIIAGKNNIITLKIGLVGYPNVGKSSIINALTRRASAHVSSVAGTTKGIQWIKSGNIKLLDSPGVIPFDDKNSKLGILGAKDPEKLNDPYLVACEIIGNFLSKNKGTLERYYDLKFNDDVEEIFYTIGKKRGFLAKGGIVDESRTAISIIRDWQRGKIKD